MNKFNVKVLGCKVNAYEAESIASLLEEKGYERGNAEESDITVVFTCAVTNTAAQKSRQMLHRAKRNHPNGVVVLAGCYSQMDQSQLMDADILVGTENKTKIPEYIETFLKTHEKKSYVKEMDAIPFEDMKVPSFSKQTRAYLKIEDGCNQFCSYCIIPHARGRERSMDPGRVIENAKLLAQEHAEIVLSGIHTGRYGKEYGLSLSDIIARMLKEVEDVRIRISSIEITEIDDQFIHLLKTEPRIANHLHIPLQSGSDTILSAMHRPYNTEEYYAKIGMIRKEIPNISISTDLIVGFPGESEELFQQTYTFLRKCNFSFLHVFPFSARNGTVAATMDGQIEESLKKARVRTCLALSEELFIYPINFLL